MANATTPVIQINEGNVGIGTTSPLENLHVSSGGGANGDCVLLIEADTDNTVEASNAILRLRQDGGAITGALSLTSNNEMTLYNEQTGKLFLGVGNSAKMSIDNNGTVDIAAKDLIIDDVNEHREDFTATGNQSISFDVDMKNIGGSGQPFEVFVGWTHYSTSYGASLHQAFFQRSAVQSNITLIHTYFNQTSSNGGSWSVSYINATTIRVTKSAGTHASSGYGYLRVTQLKP
jgi:hypothetical protein